MYLYDGERQLKIKFNPQISSFKSTLMETKLNAMGNKFPTFFRNGIVNYKEFPLSGLISYWSDEEELFMTYEELTAVRIAAGAVCGAEIISLLESLRALHPNALISRLLAKIIKSKAEKYLDIDISEEIKELNGTSDNNSNKK